MFFVLFVLKKSRAKENFPFKKNVGLPQMQVMQKKLWIGLEGMEFYAFHGVYEEEQKIGGRYVVDVHVHTDAQGAALYDDLEGTLDYEIIFHIVKKNMAQPVKLIEHVAHNILVDLRNVLPEEDTVRIKVRKLHPPLGERVAASVVELEDAGVVSGKD